MTKRMLVRIWIGLLCLLSWNSISEAQQVFESDFAKGDFATLGWKPSGPWDIFQYGKDAAKNPGPVARMAANKGEGTLVRTFPEVRNPQKLSLAIRYGWGWGDVAQPADSVTFQLLDAGGNGYAFKIHRVKAPWAVQWAKVVKNTLPKDMVWANEEIDATHASVQSGGGLSTVQVSRAPDGSWTIQSPDWNQGTGGAVQFTDATTSAFSQVVLVGTRNFDDQLFNRVVLSLSTSRENNRGVVAIPAASFLNSVGIVTTFPDRGQPLPKTIEMVKYCGFRWIRGGIEGLTQDGPTTLQTYFELHKQTGAKFSWGLVSGSSDLKKLIETARPLAAAGALLAFEGNNEPNNWGVTYQGEKGGGQAPSWQAVAKLQRDLYQTVKQDPELKKYPVWSISEAGAESDNVGLQFLEIPQGTETLFPAGTRFADYANVHNYVYHPGSPNVQDNKVWNAADPTSNCKVDGLYGNHGLTWGKRFRGYSEADLIKLPRVTTETGSTIGGAVTEEIHGLNLLNLYLAQFKRGWSYTSVYLLRDRGDEAGNQSFGFFKPDYSPRKAAVYLHNLMAILADAGRVDQPGTVSYRLSEQPATVHDLLLQKSDGTFALIIWGERVTGIDEVTVNLGQKYANVKVYNPVQGAEPVQTLPQTDAVTLTISDHPYVLQFKLE